MERLGHIEGMLSRDQRTAKLRFFHTSDDVTSSSIVQKCFDNECSPGSSSRCSIISGRSQGCCCSARTKQKTSSSYLVSWRRGYLLHRFQSLKNVLIVGVCLTLVTLPKVSSAPTNIRMSTRMKTQPKWINPCGIPPDSTDVDHSSPGVSDFDLLTQIENQAIYALNKANDFKEQFAQRTFNMKLDDLHSMLKDQDYDWLEKLPKSLGEDIPDEHFQNLELNQTLLDVYRYLQTIAVGLEQVTWDQQDRQGHFSDEFRDAEQHLRNVLCELQMTIIERGIAMQPDINRDIMGDEFRNFDATQTKTRDWIILRDYMNTLDYIVKVFGHMKEKSVA